jgi:hypothetical protein
MFLNIEISAISKNWDATGQAAAAFGLVNAKVKTGCTGGLVLKVADVDLPSDNESFGQLTAFNGILVKVDRFNDLRWVSKGFSSKGTLHIPPKKFDNNFVEYTGCFPCLDMHVADALVNHLVDAIGDLFNIRCSDWAVERNGNLFKFSGDLLPAFDASVIDKNSLAALKKHVARQRMPPPVLPPPPVVIQGPLTEEEERERFFTKLKKMKKFND